MRRVSIVFALVVLLQVSQGAVLLRFINTVPTRTPVPSRSVATGAAYANNGAQRDVVDANVNPNIDRVGLLYTVSATTPTTTVWTEIRDEASVAAQTSYSYTFAMPPLRAYHLSATGAAPTETGAVDRIANYQLTADNLSIHPSCDDINTQSQLKADGVGLYLSFAPGRYNVGAYGVRGAATIAAAQNNQGQRFTSADRVLDFTDGMVYTLIATGNGNFGANNGAGSFGDSATVSLVLIQESTAPSTFGMASLRFFHAIQNAATDSINIRDTTSATDLVSGLAFGSVSDYMDFRPSTQRNLAVVKSSNTQIPLAPTDALSLGASFDIRAGLRATIICANTDSQNPLVFCRMIPSRTVAYVRLINNNAGNLNYVVGPAASQRLQDVTLSLWATHDFPNPAEVHEQAQNLETSCTRRDAAALSHRGLYPVVQNVPVNTVSDYGEVHVPLFIMDYAVRMIIRELDCRAAPNGVAYITNLDNPQDPTNAANQRWFDLAPVFKRANFIVKTSGFATLTGRTDANAAPTKRLTDADNRKTLVNTLLLNEYVEPGQYYSLEARPVTEAVAKSVYLQLPSHVAFNWRLDRTVAAAAAGVPASVGTLRIIALFGQAFQPVTISGRSATFGGFASTFIEARSTTANKAAWVEPTTSEALSLAPGTYTLSGSTGADACINAVPSGSFTIEEGRVLELFVLGSYSCTTRSTALNLVQKTPAATTLAASECDISTPTAFLFGAAGHVAPSALWAVLLAALVAAVMASF